MDELESFFNSEQSWPFLLRLDLLNESLSFLLNKIDKPRLLKISGPSGCGKSFFTRELLIRLSEENKMFSSIYIDFPASDIDSFNAISKVSEILNSERKPDRSSPNLVTKDAKKAWQKRTKNISSSRAKYSYGVLRDLVAQIPAAGPFVKAFMPTSLPEEMLYDDNHGDIEGFKFLLAQAKKNRVCIALDNIQFIPSTLLELIEYELREVSSNLVFICVERTIEDSSVEWDQKLSNFERKNIELKYVSKSEIRTIVKHIFPLDDGTEKVTEAVFRRSEGNLKSAWFQLKLLTERRQSQELVKYNESYENVIQSLSSIDTIVLRLVVFLLGGLSITQLAQLFKTSILGIPQDSVLLAISDLSALGLLIVNSEFRDRVKVDHEIVASVVSSLTPEEEKLELRKQLVDALTELLFSQSNVQNNDVLYDRLFGIVNKNEVISNPSVLSIIVDFLHKQEGLERYEYISCLLKDTVCWEILEQLPSSSVKTLLNSLQKCSFFSLGLIAAQRLKNSYLHEELACIYQAKFLVQLFRYEEASNVLANLNHSTEKDSILFNISLNLCNDIEARKISEKTFSKSNNSTLTEFEYVILRNSAHLFPASKSETYLNASVAGFTKLGLTHSIATALNNLGIIKLVSKKLIEANKCFSAAEETFLQLNSNEIYQPMVNKAAIHVIKGEFKKAQGIIFEAKELVSNQLSMDSVMLDYNAVALDICMSQITLNEALPKLDALCMRANQTKDIRFAEILSCFTGTVHELRGTPTNLPYNPDYINNVRASGLVGIEIFIDVDFQKSLIAMPFILSPHWRH